MDLHATGIVELVRTLLAADLSAEQVVELRDRLAAGEAPEQVTAAIPPAQQVVDVARRLDLHHVLAVLAVVIAALTFAATAYYGEREADAGDRQADAAEREADAAERQAVAAERQLELAREAQRQQGTMTSALTDEDVERIAREAVERLEAQRGSADAPQDGHEGRRHQQ
jgi:hypothetical protein